MSITIPVHYITPTTKELFYHYKDDAGVDLSSTKTYTLPPGHREKVQTGISLAIPDTHVGLVCPRSGLAFRDGITIINAPGIIDAGFRGEVCVLLINLGTRTKDILPGDRIAQLLFVPITQATITQATFYSASTLSPTERGEGGFGSTGA